MKPRAPAVPHTRSNPPKDERDVEAEEKIAPEARYEHDAEELVSPEPDTALGRRNEAIHEEEDDFADGRSSAGMTLRSEEDEWGRVEPDERPFEEEDVPPREEESVYDTEEEAEEHYGR